MKPIVAIFALLFGCYAFGAGRCEALFNESKAIPLQSLAQWNTNRSLEDIGINSLNPKWQPMLLKNATQKIDETTLAYIKNVTNSLQIFDQTFQSDQLSQNFIDALKLQHTQILNGNMPGGQGYSGYVRGKVETLDWRETAGQYRKQSQILSIHLYLPESILKDVSVEKKVEIIGLPPKLFPFNNDRTIDGQRIVHHSYAEPENIQLHVERMRTLIVELAQCHNCTNEKALTLIADYYHTGINAHIFRRVNNSLLMSQVNYLLYRLNFNGLMHGDIDIYALLMGTENFRKYFLNLVREAQN
ncbi:hypothetical protein CIK05_05540 [Bdellovibrio sp. qaytius]|nr:hypothetical protein CIK05_05540 [Bdellovibrio sp. qaytius]